jgi:hypothetical protein
MPGKEYFDYLELSPRDRMGIIESEVDQRMMNPEIFGFLRYWYSNLPFGRNRKHCLDARIINQLVKDIIPLSPAYDHSEFLLHQTPRAFFNAVDAALEKNGINDEQIRPFQIRIAEAMLPRNIHPEDFGTAIHKLDILTASTYRDLRVDPGYTRLDLEAVWSLFAPSQNYG